MSGLWAGWLWCGASAAPQEEEEEEEKRGLLGDSPGTHCQSHQQMIATNIVDKVLVPPTIEPGDYLISWRWVRVHPLLVPRMDVLALRRLLCRAGL